MNIRQNYRSEAAASGRNMCKVFWDYENCPKPREISFEVAYSRIRDQLLNMSLDICGFNVYVDENCLGQLGRQTLQDLGCSVFNASKFVGNKKKPETVDMALVVDALSFALDSPCAKRTYIALITGDADFGRCMSSLYVRSFQVLLFYNKKAPFRLKANAHKEFRLYDVYFPGEPISIPSEAIISDAGHSDADNSDGDNSDADHPVHQTKKAKLSGVRVDMAELPKLSGHDYKPVLFETPALLESPVLSFSDCFRPRLEPTVDLLRDDVSIVSMENDKWDLRINDLVDLVKDICLRKNTDRAPDTACSLAFKAKYPGLGNLYKEIRGIALATGRLTSITEAGFNLSLKAAGDA